MLFPEERLKKCDHQTRVHYPFCCQACERAHEHKYEIHEDGPLGHTAYCLARHEERGSATNEFDK